MEANNEEIISETDIEKNNLYKTNELTNELHSDSGNYLTDSDIDDEKYQPNFPKQNNSLYKNNSINNINQNNQNSQNNINDTSYLKINKKYENNINYLKNELLKQQEAIKAKDNTIKEFQQSFPLFNERFNKLENINSQQKKENNNLKEKIIQLENELKEEKEKLKQTEDDLKNNKLFEEHINELQNNYSEKEKKLVQKYTEKENKIKSELMDEIS